MTAVDHCGTGNTASPSFTRETYAAHKATHCVTWHCMDCGTVLSTESRTRPLVRSRPGYCGDGSDPDRGGDPHLSGARA